jgi:hypothetical protein
MQYHKRALFTLAAAGSLLFGVMAAGEANAAAIANQARSAAFVCSGTAKSPGTLAGGYYGNVLIKGVCYVDGGIAKVGTNLTVTRGSALIAAFALNHVTKHGASVLLVGRNLIVEPGATLIMGCERHINHFFGKASPAFPCIDDPHPSKPTLSSHAVVGGDLIARDALGVVVHGSTIGRSVLQHGGGGGLTCKPMGIFKAIKSPVYSDYEDNTVGRNLHVTDLRSCWFGALRDHIGGNGLFSRNKMADPDAMEVNTNVVLGNLVCEHNHPAVQYGDSDGRPNRVGGRAAGQCGFNVILPSPAPEAHLHVKVKYLPISVRLRSHR